MKRKLVKQGDNALTMTLPAVWTKKFTLKPGDEVDVNEVKDKLQVSAKKEVVLEKGTIDTKEIGEYDKNYLSTMYHLGFDEIEVFFDNDETLTMIKERLAEQCIGFEIVDQSEGRIVVKSLSPSVADEEYDRIQRKLFLMLLTMGEDMLDAIKKGELKRLKQIRLMEGLNNKFTGFCQRILSKHGLPGNLNRTPSAYILIKDLERLADQFKYMCDFLTSRKENVKVNKEVLDLFADTNEYLRAFYEMFYKFDKERASKAILKHKEVIARAPKVFALKNEVDVRLGSHLYQILTQTRESTSLAFQLQI